MKDLTDMIIDLQNEVNYLYRKIREIEEVK